MLWPLQLCIQNTKSLPGHGTAKLLHLDVTRKRRNQSEGSHRTVSRNKRTCSEMNFVNKIHPMNGVMHSQGNQMLHIVLSTNWWRACVRTYRDHVSENLWRFFLPFFLSTILPFLVNAFLFHSNLLFAYSFLSLHTMYTGKPEGKRPLWKPRLRWQDNIKIHIKGIVWVDADWIHPAHIWDICFTLVQVVLHMQFPKNTGYFLTS